MEFNPQHVRVEWVDASDPPNNTSWFTDAEVEQFAKFEVRVISTGYVKSRTKLYLTLCSDYIINEDGSITWGRPTKVPIGMIQVEQLMGVSAGDAPKEGE